MLPESNLGMLFSPLFCIHAIGSPACVYVKSLLHPLPSIRLQPVVSSCILLLSCSHLQLRFQLISHLFHDAFCKYFNTCCYILVQPLKHTIAPQIYPVVHNITSFLPPNFIFASFQPTVFSYMVAYSDEVRSSHHRFSRHLPTTGQSCDLQSLA